MAKTTLISLIIPVYNEEENIDSLLDRLCAVTAELGDRYRFEFVFTDNCSSDRTFDLLAGHALTDSRIRVFRFSRNFGFQRSILTGYLKARGEAAIQLDADLQDPPELIASFLEKWQDGYDVVYGVRRGRKEGPVISLGRRIYYRLINAVSDYPIARDAGDFRLISRRVIEVLRKIEGSVPYIRGTIAEIGFPQIGIPYDRAARTAGASKFNLLRLVRFGLDGLFHQSSLPLRLSGLFGVTIGLGGLVLAVYYVVRYMNDGATWPSGFATLALILLFTMMMNAFFFAIIGEYVARLYRQSKGMPVTIIDRTIDPIAPNTTDTPDQDAD